MKQRTLAKAVEIVGIGLHSGLPVTMRLEPMPIDSGILFYRKDKGITLPVDAKYVVDTRLATVLGRQGVSCISAYGIDNLRVVIDSDEVPTMDGSSASFCILLDEAGILQQEAKKRVMVIKKEVVVSDGPKFAKLLPAKRNEILFEISFSHPVIRDQKYRFLYTKENYIKEIARARTFGFLKEIQYLHSIGKGKGGSLENCIVLDDKRVLNGEGLRFQDEFVRHKILDAIGDMAFLGMPFMGRYESFAGSHHLNHLLTKAVLENADAYEIVEVGEARMAELEHAFAKS